MSDTYRVTVNNIELDVDIVDIAHGDYVINRVEMSTGTRNIFPLIVGTETEDKIRELIDEKRNTRESVARQACVDEAIDRYQMRRWGY